jgi:GNAT superfamily N-acetyltransferase
VAKAYIRPKYRRQGILTALLEDLPNYHKKTKGRIGLNTDPKNLTMQAAVAKLGYSVRCIEYQKPITEKGK